MKKKFGIILLVIVTLLWSNGFLAVQNAIDAQVSVEGILSIRFLLATVILSILNFKKLKKVNIATLKHGVIAGIILYIAFYAQTSGQSTTSISLVALISSGYVIFVPFFTWLFRKQQPSLKTYAFTFLTMVGIIILNYQGGSLNLTVGIIWVFVCAIAFGAHVAFIGAFCHDDETIPLVVSQLFVAGVLSLATAFITHKVPTINELKNGAYGVLYLAIFSTAICYYLQILGQKFVKAENTAIILSLEGVFAAMLSVALKYEPFSIHIAIGGAIIFFCAIGINIGEQGEV